MVVLAEEATVVGSGSTDAVRRYRICRKILAAVEKRIYGQQSRLPLLALFKSIHLV